MAQLARIPLEKIEKIQLFVNDARKKLSVIKQESGADYVINGTLYDMSAWKPVMHFRADGKTLSEDEYNYYGYGWDVGADIRVVQSKDKASVRNYICGTELIRDGKPISKLIYNSAVGGARGRTAIGIGKGGELFLYCVADGSGAGRCTPEELREELASLGTISALMLDGGNSSQCRFPKGTIDTGRVVENAILVFLKKEEEKPVKQQYTVCLDPGHGGSDHSNGSPDGKYKEHEFSLDLAKRIRVLLQKQGLRVVMTRETDTTVNLRPRADFANAQNADVFVSIHSNASAGGGWTSASGLVCYVYKQGGKREELANRILQKMREAGIKIFGSALYYAGYAVLKYTNMPAVLVEYGFHTNKQDVANLSNSAYRDKLAIQTAKAICGYFGVEYSEKKTKYAVTIPTFDSYEQAKAVANKLAEIGVDVTIKEVES